MNILRRDLVLSLALAAAAVLAAAPQSGSSQVAGSAAIQPEAWQIVLLARAVLI